MGIRARWFLFMTGVVVFSLPVGSASANTATASLKCNSQRDQIWVYDSLSSFDVVAKLKCGEYVEIVGRVDGYVKIRAQNDLEGYVPEAALINLPSLQISPDPTHDVGLAAKQAQAKEIAEVAARDAFPAPADSRHSGTAPLYGSAAADPAKNTSEKKTTRGSSMAPFATYADITPAPASSSAKETSSDEPKGTSVPEPPVENRSSSSYISVVDANAGTIINRPKGSAVPTGYADEISDLQPPSESANLACQKYFSAYGLTPSQMKWMAQNRKRLFSNICPAPDPSKVDFVIIFTHDVNFFSTTMPEPVHKSNGFSDFTPMTPIDTALVPESEADKAHREYVWIFQFAKGTFDPASFSPHSQYQFSKMETNSLGSKASLKTVADAFQFVAAANH